MAEPWSVQNVVAREELAETLAPEKEGDIYKHAPMSLFKAIGTRAKGLAETLGHGVELLSAVLSETPSEIFQKRIEPAWTAVTRPRSIFEPTRTDIAKSAVSQAILGPGIGRKILGDPSVFEEDPMGSALDLLLGAPAVGIPAAAGASIAASKVGRMLPTRITEPISKQIAKIVPRYRFPEGMYEAEAQTAGEVFGKTIFQTRQQLKETAGLSPEASAFMEPTSLLSTKERRAFKKEYKRTGAPHLEFQPNLQPGAMPKSFETTPFSFMGKDVTLSVGKHGEITPVSRGKFAALSPDEQAKSLRAREAVDANQQLLVEAGILKPEQAIPGYLHQSYEAIQAPRAWQAKLFDASNPHSVATLNAARNWITTHIPGANPDAIIDGILRRAQTLDVPRGIPVADATVFGPELTSLMARKRMPPELRALLGPAPAGSMRLGQTLDYQIRLLTNDTLLHRMERLTGNDGRPLLEVGPKRHRDFVTLPDSPYFGKWGGANVHPDVVDMLDTMRGESPWGFAANYIQMWRTGKVVGNVPTHVNNMMGDVMFSMLAGGNIASPRHWGTMSTAVKEMTSFWNEPLNLKKFPKLQEAIANGAVVPGFASRELAHQYAQVAGRKVSNWADALVQSALESQTAQKFVRAYDLEDALARYGTYRILTEKYGKTPAQASMEITQSFPNYQTTSRLGAFLRGQHHPAGAYVGAPFASFTLEAARILAVAAEKHPIRLMAVSSLPLSATILGMGAQGMTLADYWEFHKNLPSHMRGRILVPTPIPGEEPYFHDWSSIMPLAETFQTSETASDYAGRSMPGIPGSSLVLSGPVMNFLSVLWGQDLETGQEFYQPERGDRVLDAMRKLTMKMSPFPSMLERGGARVASSAKGVPYERWQQEPEGYGEAIIKELLPQAFKTRPLSGLEEAGRAVRGAERKETGRRQRGMMRDPRIEEGEKEWRLENILRRKEELIERRR